LAKGQRLATDAEVLQEILHGMLRSVDAKQSKPAFHAVVGIVDPVLAVDPSIVDRAKEIVLGYRQVSAHDAVHLAVMERYKACRMLAARVQEVPVQVPGYLSGSM
jgi:predicted nucleic acid-binding protein